MTSPAEQTRQTIIATVMREHAEMMAAFDAPWHPNEVPAADRRYQRPEVRSASAMFSLRLDRRELDALRRRATYYGIPASALARNLIRVGLSTPADPPTD